LGVKSISQTDPSIRREWDKNNHKFYSIRLRIKDDADLIEYIDSHKAELGTSHIFREALRKFLEG
jgi:hypothetical protein